MKKTMTALIWLTSQRVTRAGSRGTYNPLSGGDECSEQNKDQERGGRGEAILDSQVTEGLPEELTFLSRDTEGSKPREHPGTERFRPRPSGQSPGREPGRSLKRPGRGRGGGWTQTGSLGETADLWVPL